MYVGLIRCLCALYFDCVRRSNQNLEALYTIIGAQSVNDSYPFATRTLFWKLPGQEPTVWEFSPFCINGFALFRRLFDRATYPISSPRNWGAKSVNGC
jgi:hypothetical protein